MKIVNSFNEWDPLEEIIVGNMFGATVPDLEIPVEATMPEEHHHYMKTKAGQLFPDEYTKKASEELDIFAEMLSSMGIVVKRPDKILKNIPYSSPYWKSKGGLYSAMPRDSLLVVGDKIIEAPMAWRSRYFEVDAFRPLLKDYFRQGAIWISAPKPQLVSETYNSEYDKSTPYLSDKYAVSEFEPTFDAADFIRCGKDIFVQKSHVTNDFGIEWVRRALGSDFHIHKIEHMDDAPMHIDATLLPLSPGKLMIHPFRIQDIPKQFKDWEVRKAPIPTHRENHTMYMSSPWLSMNVLMLSPFDVVVEHSEKDTIKFLENWGFNVCPVKFENVIRFGGAFHCVTTDIRRNGILESYF